MKDIIIGIIVGVVLISTGFFLAGILSLTTPENVGGTIGSDIYQRVQFYDQATFSCARIYQLGATTNSSTTYYLVASTTHGTSGEVQNFKVMATSTKPTNC